MSNVIQFDPATQILVIGGRELSDYADGDAVEITAGGDLSKVEKGGRGDVAITTVYETTAELKVTVIKNSPTAGYLGLLFWKWRTKQPMVLPATRQGLTMQWKNTANQTLATGSNLTPKTEPPMTGGDTNGKTVFTFIVCNYLPLHGGA